MTRLTKLSLLLALGALCLAALWSAEHTSAMTTESIGSTRAAPLTHKYRAEHKVQLAQAKETPQAYQTIRDDLAAPYAESTSSVVPPPPSAQATPQALHSTLSPPHVSAVSASPTPAETPQPYKPIPNYTGVN